MAFATELERGSTLYRDLALTFQARQESLASGAVIPPHGLVAATSTGLNAATANSPTVIGANRRDYAVTQVSATPENWLEVGAFRTTVVADVAFAAGLRLKAANGARVCPLVTAAGGGGITAGSTIKASAAGGNFGNQPLNDGIAVLSSSAADTTQTVTVYGTTTSTNTVVKEVIALNGTTAVPSVKLNWGQILGVFLSASCAGTVTVRKVTGPATITTLATTVLSAGAVAVTAPGLAYNTIPAVVAGGASTKQFGVIGTDSTGAVQLDSVALNGTTSVPLNSSFQSVQFILVGDNATATVATLSVGPADTAGVSVGVAIEAAAAPLALIDAVLKTG
jgi:hypothetical protein